MRRPLAAFSEVIGTADQALAEVMLPDPIDHDARRQWVIGTCQPVGELSPSAAFEDRQRTLARQDLRHAARNDFPEILGIAADKNRSVLEALVARALGTAVLHDNRLRNLP